jgi:putative SOS response-associated peptidase YedK
MSPSGPSHIRYNRSMCGRYTIAHPEDIAARFNTLPLPLDLKPTYNAAPSQALPVVIQHDAARVIDVMEWGLLPAWAKGKTAQIRPINARSEGLDAKPFYRGPFKYRRCIVPVDGFYEWKTEGKVKIPYYFKRPDNALMGLAGLWESALLPDTGAEVHTFTIITTTPSDLMKPIHDRMPVIIDPNQESAWLETSPEDAGLLRRYLQPQEGLECFPVSPDVNNTRNNSAELIGPINSA